MNSNSKRPKAVLSTIRSDSHSWNLVYIEMFLKEQGLNVINLGSCTPHDLIIRTCIQDKPDILVVSTINGHGYIEGLKLIKDIRKISVLKNMNVIIGGKLYPVLDHSQKAYFYQNRLKDGGYNMVFGKYSMTSEDDLKVYLNKTVLKNDSVNDGEATSINLL